jgi:hypothetical protein
MPGMIRTSDAVTVVRGEEEVWRRTAHLFESARTVTCTANHLATWQFGYLQDAARALPTGPLGGPRRRVRKIYHSGMLLDQTWRQRIAVAQSHGGIEMRVTADEMNETIILDGRIAILAGDERGGERSYSLITQRETVRGVMSLYENAWRSATDLEVYDAKVAEIRALAPQVLDLLSAGVKDEAAARKLGLSVRTYRRRVAELMAALGAESRFQAGVRAREVGLV